MAGRLSLKLEGNRFHVYSGGGLDPVLHVHCVTGGLIAPAEGSPITEDMVTGVVELLATKGQAVLSGRVRLWWENTRPTPRPGR